MQEQSRTVALLGGTFNPVHYGHLDIARSARNELGYDTIVLVPALLPVHKIPDTVTSPHQRLAMLRLAVADIDYVAIDDCEIRRGGPSYTIDTVLHVYSTYRLSGKPGLIIGDDLLDGFGTWRRLEELTSKVDLIVARRTSPREKVFPYEHRYLDNTLNVAASSDIRRIVRDGGDIEKHVPAAVARYIVEHEIYQRSVD
jgi:nicotinate-nucleotide adenylyltransferase